MTSVRAAAGVKMAPPLSQMAALGIVARLVMEECASGGGEEGKVEGREGERVGRKEGGWEKGKKEGRENGKKE